MIIRSAGSVWSGPGSWTDLSAIRLSTGTKWRKGKDSDLAIQSALSMVRRRRPRATNWATSQTLIEDTYIARLAIASARTLWTLGGKGVDWLSHQTHTWVSRTITGELPNLLERVRLGSDKPGRFPFIPFYKLFSQSFFIEVPWRTLEYSSRFWKRWFELYPPTCTTLFRWYNFQINVVQS